MSVDAVTYGKLRFATVAHFSPRAQRGVACLMDGTRLPFIDADGRSVVKRGGVLQFGDGRPRSRPSGGRAIMVDVAGGVVRRWTRPHDVLGAAICDRRYVQMPHYCRPVRYPGLHWVVDVTQLKRKARRGLPSRQGCDFPATVYVGHHADRFIERHSGHYALFGWQTFEGTATFVGFHDGL